MISWMQAESKRLDCLQEDLYSDQDGDSTPKVQDNCDLESIDDVEERDRKRCKLAEGVASMRQQVKRLQVRKREKMATGRCSLDIITGAAVERSSSYCCSRAALSSETSTCPCGISYS